MSTLTPQTTASQPFRETHGLPASGPSSPDAKPQSHTQQPPASGDLPLPATKACAIPNDPPSPDPLPESASHEAIPIRQPLVQDPSSLDATHHTHTHRADASGEPTLPRTSHHDLDTHLRAAGAWEYDEGMLLLLCKTVDELEELRKATDNRVRQMTRKATDKDGEVRGLGMDARSPHVAKAQALAEGVQALEKQAVRDLEKAMREHPLHGFIAGTRGLGAKTVARLLAEIGDPYWHPLYNRPRTVSELWAFCGLAVKEGRAQARRRGEQANWSDTAKKRAWIIAQPAIKTKGPYRDVYDAARERYADAVHPHDCVRCGPSGKPALAGSPLSAAHQHARAVRAMCKAILRDLWAASRVVHEAALPAIQGPKPIREPLAGSTSPTEGNNE